jgi:hypothetical protein
MGNTSTGNTNMSSGGLGPIDSVVLDNPDIDITLEDQAMQ